MLFTRFRRRETVHGTAVETMRAGPGRSRGKRRIPRRLSVESLEHRRLMCVAPFLPGGAAAGAAAFVAQADEPAPANTPPVALDDAYAMNGHQQLGANVLANDTDAEGDALGVALVSGPSHGTLTLDAGGPFTYSPDRGFDGVDTFTYRLSDSKADSNVATVSVTVARVNDPPAAAGDGYRVDEDQTLSVAGPGVLVNDTDANEDALSAILVTGPRSGTLVLGADGSFDYTPNADFHGSDSFTYLANDGQADSNPATVTIAMDPVGSPPAKELNVHLDVSSTPFGPEAGPIWGGSTFWVSSYVEDLREAPQGVVGGAIDLEFDSSSVTPTGNVAYGEHFTDYRQGTVDAAAGVIDEAGALATEGGVGAHGAAQFIAWEFRRSGPSAPDDPNRQVVFAADPGEGAATILPANFALVGLGSPVDWQNVDLNTADLSLYLGDFNGDGAVNHYDLALWIPHDVASPGDGNFDPKFDLNADSRVDGADLAVLMPRLYQPVNVGEAPAGLAAVRAPVHRIGSAPWDAAAGDDLDWVDSLPLLHPHKRDAHHETAAIDRVLQGYDPRFSS